MGGCPSYLTEDGQMKSALKPLIEDYFRDKNLATPEWVRAQDFAKLSELEDIQGSLQAVASGTATQTTTTTQNAMSLSKSQAKFLVDMSANVKKDSQNLLEMNGSIAQMQEYAVPTCANAPAMMCYFPTSTDNDAFASSFQPPADHSDSGLCTFSRPLETDTIRVLDGTFVNTLRVDTINGACQYKFELAPDLQDTCQCAASKCKLTCTCGSDPPQSLDVDQVLRGLATDTCLVTREGGTLQCTPAIKCPGKTDFKPCTAEAGTCTQFAMCREDAASVATTPGPSLSNPGSSQQQQGA